MKSDYLPLGSFAHVKGGKRLPPNSRLTQIPTQHPYIRVRDLGNCKTLELNTDYQYIDDTTQSMISRYTVSENDIIISIVGTIGLIAKIGRTLDGANLTENCAKIIELKNLDADFLYYYLTSVLGQSEIAAATVGAVQAKLPLKNILTLQIPNLPFPEQKAIAAVLSALDDKIELNNRINRNLEAQAQAIFKSWFVDFDPFRDGEFVDSELGPIPKGWRIGVIGELVCATLGGDWGKEESIGNYSQDVYCIRGADISEIAKGNRGKMPIRYILPKNLKSKKLSPNSIVVEISGGSPTQSTGRCTLISQWLLERYDKNMICTNFCRAVMPIEDYANFVYYYWKYLYSQNVMFLYENGTTGIKNFDISGFLNNETIVIPPAHELKRFNAFICKIMNVIFSKGKENETLALIRDTLLPKLMSGEIRVPLEV